MSKLYDPGTLEGEERGFQEYFDFLKLAFPNGYSIHVVNEDYGRHIGAAIIELDQDGLPTDTDVIFWFKYQRVFEQPISQGIIDKARHHLDLGEGRLIINLPEGADRDS